MPLAGLLIDKASRRLLAAAAAIVLANPLLTFAPSPKQQTVIESTAPLLLVRAGNQVGKTASGAIRAWRFVLEAPRTLLILCADHKAKVDVVGRALHDWAPRGMLEAKSDYTPARGWRNDVIQLTNGSRIIFRSSESRTTAVSGLTVDGLWIDEPPPEHLWGEAMGRVAVARGRPPRPGCHYPDGIVWLTMTPIGREVTWLRRLIEGDQTTTPPTPPQQVWSQVVIRLSVEDCPHRTQGSIDAQVSAYGAWEYAARVDGAWEGETPDAIFDGFTENSVTDSIPAALYSFGLGLDHGELAGHEVAELAAWDRKRKRVYVVDCWESQAASEPAGDAAAIREWLTTHNLTPASIDLAHGDNNSAGKSMVGVTVNAMLEEYLAPMRIRPALKGIGSVDYGIRLINMAFRRGHLQVHSRAAGLIKSLRHWQGKDDDLKHHIDGLRYILVPVLESLYTPAELDRLRMSRP